MAIDEGEVAAVQAFLAALGSQISDESCKRGNAFKPREGDVLVVTPPKCGTTLTQQARGVGAGSCSPAMAELGDGPRMWLASWPTR